MLCQFCLDDLIEIREEWEEATEGESLLEVRTSVGLLLNDVCNALALSPAQRFEVLGERLAGEIGLSFSMSLAQALVYAVDGDLPVNQTVKTFEGYQLTYTGSRVILDAGGKQMVWRKLHQQIPANVP
jgi:hypothetical protein